MAPNNPSIQSFSLPSSSSAAPPSSPRLGDGFTPEEIEQALSTVPSITWEPATDYEDYNIGDLIPGPRHVTFTGRIGNLSDFSRSNKLPKAAKGCLRMIITDGTGAITVKLCHAKLDYRLRIGQLVTIWATNIFNGERNGPVSTSAPLLVNLFPEREKSCHFTIIDGNASNDMLCRAPFSFEDDQNANSLMTLKNFVDGGWEVNGARIIVIVKSIGARKKVTNKDGSTSDVVSVGVHDDSEEASLSLWGVATASVTTWKPSETVLLITNLGCNVAKRNWLSLTSESVINVDPDLPDTKWLRKFAGQLVKREHVNPAVPLGVSSATVKNAKVRVLYTIADIDDRVRETPQGQRITARINFYTTTETQQNAETFFGFLNVNVMELKFLTLHRRKMLLCAECCGVPLFANTTVANCKQCEKTVNLRINPQAVGQLIDETGCIGAGKLIFSDEAWKQMLEGQIEDMTGPAGKIKKFEQRLLFRRITLVFYWSAEVGRLAILGVEKCEVK